MSPSSRDNFSGAAAAGASSFAVFGFFAAFGALSAVAGTGSPAGAAASAGAGVVSADFFAASGAEALGLVSSLFFVVFFDSGMRSYWLDFPCLRVLVTDDTYGFPRSFTGTSVG